MTAAARAKPAPDDESTGFTVPWPLYVLAPFVVIPGVLLGLWMLPAIVFAALTIRRAVKVKSNAWAVVYACAFGLVFVASFAWPFALMYGLSLLL